MYDLYNEPSVKNGIHTGLDFGNQIRHIIPGKIDDVFLQIPGAIDDGYNAVTGRDILEDGSNYIERKLNSKPRYTIKTNFIEKDNNDNAKIMNLRPVTIYSKRKGK